MVCLREGRDRSVEREKEVLFVFGSGLFCWGGLLSSLFVFKRELLGVWTRGGGLSVCGRKR